MNGEEMPDLPRNPSEAIAEAQAEEQEKDTPQAITDALEERIAGNDAEPMEMP